MMAVTAGAALFLAWAAMFPMPAASSGGAASEAKLGQPETIAPTPQIFADGIVEGANQELALRFEVPGRIKAIHVREGDSVRAGDVLAELETDSAELLLAEARIRHKLATAERDRLVSESSRQALDAAREKRVVASAPPLSREEQTLADGKIELAQTAIRREQLLLDKCRLRAPSDGVVLRSVGQPGELTGPNDERELLTLVNPGAMRVRAFVEELDGRRVRRGQLAVVSATGEPRKTYPGTVAACSLYFRPKSQRLLKPGERLDMRVREVIVDLDDGQDLLIGLPVEVMIER